MLLHLLCAFICDRSNSIFATTEGCEDFSLANTTSINQSKASVTNPFDCFWKGWIVDCKKLPTSDMMDRNTCTALNRSAIRPQVEADYAEISVANEPRRKADNASHGCSTMCIQHRWNNRSWNAIHSVVLSALHSTASSCPRRNALPYGRHNKMGNKMIMKSTSCL